MSEHPYHSMGARQDRARTWSLLERIAVALEKIAASHYPVAPHIKAGFTDQEWADHLDGKDLPK